MTAQSSPHQRRWANQAFGEQTSGLWSGARSQLGATMAAVLAPSQQVNHQESQCDSDDAAAAATVPTTTINSERLSIRPIQNVDYHNDRLGGLNLFALSIHADTIMLKFIPSRSGLRLHGRPQNPQALDYLYILSLISCSRPVVEEDEPCELEWAALNVKAH